MGNGLCVETSSSWTVFDWLDKVLGSIGSYAGVSKSRSDDNFADRLSHHYTPVILIIFTIIVSTKQYAGDPIQCWCPAQYTEAQVEYTKMVCWVSNTYYIPMSDVIPKDIDKREDAKISYYQWVPIILLFQALMFKVPRIFWKAVSNSIGLSIDKATNYVFRLEMASGEERDQAMRDLILYLDKWFRWRIHYNDNRYVRGSKTLAKYSCICANRRYGNFFITASIVTKIVYFTHAILQFFFLNIFLGADFVTWGFQIITGQVDDEADYQRTTVFPKVTLCDFELRQLQNIQRSTVQCVLSINLFNSRIFFFIWLWLAMLMIGSFYTLVTNGYSMMVPMNRVQYIKKYLKLYYIVNDESLPPLHNDRSSTEEIKPGENVRLLKGNGNQAETRKHVKKYFMSNKSALKGFVMDYLKFDGFFVLRIMSQSGNEILTAEVIKTLWEQYLEKQHETEYEYPPEERKAFPHNGSSNPKDYNPVVL